MKAKAVLFLGCFFLLLGCSDPIERSLEYLESAKGFYEKENYEKAKLELRNAVQINDKLPEAFYYLALINEKNSNWKDMYANLAQAIALDPENLDARLKLTRLYLLSGDMEAAKKEVDYLIHKNPDNPDVIVLKGVLNLKQGDTATALTEANKALTINAASPDAVGLVVSTYLVRNDFVAAETEVNKALEKNPDDLELHVLKLQVLERSGNKQQLEQSFKDIIQRYPSNHKFSYALAKLYVETEREADAIDLLNKVVEANPEELQPKLTLLSLLVIKDPQQAETRLNKYIADNPDETDFHLILADLYVKQGKHDEARSPLAWVAEHNGDDKKGLAAKMTLAKITLKSGDNEKALTLVEDVLKVDGRNYQGLLLKSRISIISGRYDEAITDLRGVLTDYAESDEAMVLLGEAYTKKKSPVLAEEQYRKALEINPGNFFAVMPVVTRMLESKDITRADEILQNALKTNPNHAGALKALAQIRLMRKDWSGTQKVADLISSKPKGEGFSHYLSGKIYQGQGSYQTAIEKFKSALALTPTISDALSSMMLCYEALQQRGEMNSYIDEFIQKNPKLPTPVFIKARLHNLNGNFDKALDILNKGIEQWPKTYQFYEEMAKIYTSNNETDNALIVYQRGLDEIPENVQLRMLLAYAYEVKKDYAKAVDNYEIVLAKYSKADGVTNNLVSLLLDHFPGKENFERAVKLTKHFETSRQPFYRDTYGWALLHNGKTNRAVEILQQVVVMQPNVAIFKYHLGVAYHKSGNDSQAVKLLEQALIAGSNQQQPFLEKEKAETLLKEISG